MICAPLAAPVDVSPQSWGAADFQWICQIDCREMWCSPTPTRIPPYHRESFRNIGILACPFGVPTARQCDNRQRTSVRLLVRPFPSLDVSFTEMLTTSDSRKVDHPSSWEPKRTSGGWESAALLESHTDSRQKCSCGRFLVLAAISRDCLPQTLCRGIQPAAYARGTKTPPASSLRVS